MNIRKLQDTLSSPGWEEVEKLLELYIAELQKQEPDMTDQFKMTCSVVDKNAGINHLRAFFKYLDDNARK